LTKFVSRDSLSLQGIVENTFGLLRLSEILDNALNARVFNSLLQNHGDILEDDFVGDIRKLLSKFNALVSNASSNINEQWLLGAEILHSLLVGVRIQPRTQFLTSLTSHVRVEVSE
jgi:hypothetical protein